MASQNNERLNVIDVSEIHMIKVIPELGSINKAAEVLNMSQPTLSKKVSRIEQKVKLELFYRDSAGMVPTAAAKFLMQKSQDLSNQLHDIERQLELMTGMVGGTVKVGVGPIVEQSLLPKVLLDFAEQDYQFNISVVTMSIDDLFDMLMKSEIDLAVGIFSEESIPKEFVTPLKTSEKSVVAVRSGHKLAGKKSVSMKKIAKYKSVLPTTPKSVLKQMGDTADKLSSPHISCENYAMARMIVMNTDYITTGPESVFHNEFVSGELVKVDVKEEIELEFLCLAKPESLKMPVVKEVVSLFSQYMDDD